MNTVARVIASIAVPILPVAMVIIEFLAWIRFGDWLTRNAPASFVPYMLYGSGCAVGILAFGLIALWARPRVGDISRDYGLIIGWSILAMLVLVSLSTGFLPGHAPWEGDLALRAIEVLLGLHIWFGCSMTAFTIALRPRRVQRRKPLMVSCAVAPLVVLIPLAILDDRLNWPWC
ncbi:hypothetical protein [Curtobacterium sp. Leaf261]|uniref:hypothetical protein n=1 Tax=Curtobacterium sp. Leaf261 TaxID=1736311 RepID=UPI0007127E80|nr:hypothetical protein [Curtobacterium sp. Leaf261]KQO62252.1 hypothetical protein ASF23_10590 [Curtobacterium sp. Leaf261]